MALTDDLISYWKLDESSGNASDFFGGNTATNTSVTYTTGKLNNCAVFNGSANLKTGNVSLISSTAFSISLWVKTSYTGGTATMMVAQDGSSRLFQVGITSSNARFIRFNSSDGVISNFTSSGQSIADNTWRHVVCVFDNSVGSVIYIDSVSRGSDSVTTSNNTTSIPISIGSNTGETPGELFTGNIDEVAVWSRALSSTEVSEIYNSGNGIQFTKSFTISETLSLVESITNLRALQSTISETLGISETWTALKGILFTISETITTSEVWTTTRGLVSTVIDTLGLSEIVTLVKKWTNQTKSSSTWSNSTKNTSTFTNQTKNTSNWDNQNKN